MEYPECATSHSRINISSYYRQIDLAGVESPRKSRIHFFVYSQTVWISISFSRKLFILNGAMSRRIKIIELTISCSKDEGCNRSGRHDNRNWKNYENHRHASTSGGRIGDGFSDAVTAACRTEDSSRGFTWFTNVRERKLSVTTESELIGMSTAASRGLMTPTIASVAASALYNSETHRFRRMTHIVRRDAATSSTIPDNPGSPR